MMVRQNDGREGREGEKGKRKIRSVRRRVFRRKAEFRGSGKAGSRQIGFGIGSVWRPQPFLVCLSSPHSSCPPFHTVVHLTYSPSRRSLSSTAPFEESTMSVSSPQKKFTQRNVFYLRASPYVVLQTILYLDHRHVTWMNLNPSILTQVLSILRTRIMPKLRKESDSSGKLSAMSKKERVDVYSDRDFQVAYFFRRMDDRHSVLLKEKSLVFPSDPSLGEVKVEMDEEVGGGRLHAPIPRAGSATPWPPARRSGVGESSATAVSVKDSPEPEASLSSPNTDLATLSGEGDVGDNALFRGGGQEEDDALAMPPPASTSTRRTRRSASASDGPQRRSKRVRIQEDTDVKPDPAALDVNDSTADAQPSAQEGAAPGEAEENAAIVITEEDEEKMKPKLQVKYAGFRM